MNQRNVGRNAVQCRCTCGLPALGAVATRVGTRARGRIKRAVRHLDFVHAVDVQLGVDNFLLRVDHRAVAFVARHVFALDMQAMAARHTRATGWVARGALFSARHIPHYRPSIATTVAVTIVVAAGQGCAGVHTCGIQRVEFHFGNVVAVAMAQFSVGDWHQVTARTCNFAVPVRRPLVFRVRANAWRCIGGVTSQILGRR